MRTPARPALGRYATPLAVLCAAQFVLQLDFSIVNVALRTIQAELHFSEAGLQWVATSYALTFGSLLLLGGRLGDRVGRRRMLLGGLSVFAVASLAGGLAPNPGVLVAARFVQGFGAAMLAPSILAALTSAYEEGPARTRALGVWTAATASGGTTGIVVGGALTQWFGWRSVFLVNLPLIALLLPLARKVLPHDPGDRTRSLDPAGAALITLAIAGLIYGLTEGEQKGFGAVSTLVVFAVSAALLAGFVAVERTVATPLVRFGYLSLPVRRTSTVVLIVLGGVMTAYAYFMALYLQRVLGYSELRTALALIPAPLTMIFSSTVLCRRVIVRFGLRAAVLCGLVIMAVGQLCFSRLGAHSGYASGVLPGLIINTLGGGLAFPAVSAGITSEVQPEDQGLAGGLIPSAQQIGAAVGLALLATLAATTTRNDHGSLVSGYRTSYLAGAIAVAVTFVVVALASLRGARAARLAVVAST